MDARWACVHNNKQCRLTVSGQPLVVLDADWSKHRRWQVNVHDALPSQLVVKVTASVVGVIARYTRRQIFLFAPTFDTANELTIASVHVAVSNKQTSYTGLSPFISFIIPFALERSTKFHGDGLTPKFLWGSSWSLSAGIGNHCVAVVWLLLGLEYAL